MTGPQIAFDAPQYSVSAPKQIVWHVISEEELGMLVAGGKDTSLEWGLAMGGAGIGLTQNLIKVASEVQKGTAISGLDFALAILSIALLAGAAMCIWYYCCNTTAIGQIENRVRNREAAQS